MDSNDRNSSQRFVKCCYCSMYSLMSYEDYWNINDNVIIKCNECVQKESLLAQITNLTKEVAYLNDRLSASRTLQTLEREIDTSIEDLSRLFAAATLSETIDSTTPSEINISVANNETIPAEITENTSIDTSIWVDSEDEESSESLAKSNSNHITMFLGDTTIKNIKLNKNNSDLQEGRQVFKIARHNADVDDLSETAEFFIDKIGSEHEVTEIILHANTVDINQRQSEITKNKFKSFLHKFQQKGIKVIISGPIPNPQCSKESFSRLLEMNNWLNKLNDDNKHFTFINNFDIFWNKGFMFSKKHLNKIGDAALLCNILQNLPQTE